MRSLSQLGASSCTTQQVIVILPLGQESIHLICGLRTNITQSEFILSCCIHTQKKTRSPLIFCYPLSLGTIQTQGTPVFATSINSFHSLSPFHTSSKSKYSSLISLIADRKKNTSCRASSCRTAALLL
jgi:hypothetical protein